jgi:TRAP-type C4-dicarboxylate transport system permease small subunit
MRPGRGAWAIALGGSTLWRSHFGVAVTVPVPAISTEMAKLCHSNRDRLDKPGDPD